MKTREEKQVEIKSAKFHAFTVSSTPFKIMFSVFVIYTNGRAEYLPQFGKEDLQANLKKYEKYLDEQSKINVKGWMEYPSSYTSHAGFWSSKYNKALLAATVAATAAASCAVVYKLLKK